MIIGDKSTSGLSRHYTRGIQTSKVAPAQHGDAAARADASGEDQVEISAGALLLQKATDQALSAADVRWDRVGDLRQRIAQGTYQVPTNALVGRLLQDA